MRYKITLSYIGKNFSGWQIQNNANSIQGELNRALSLLLREEISVTGAGRTDSGVNAINYTAHFDTKEAVSQFDASTFAYKINAIIHKDIVVHNIEEVQKDFHSRYNAIEREYHYFVHLKRDPFVEKFSYKYRYPVDVDKMNEAAKYLIGEHDFSCFEKTGGNNKTSICQIFEAKWETYVPTHVKLLNYEYEDGAYLVFKIRGNRFLRDMVRAIVGTLLDVGRGRKEPSWIKELIENGNRSNSGDSVPGNALFFGGAKY